MFDTSALLPLFIEGHPHRSEAKDAFDSATAVVLHPAVIAEFTRVLRRLTKDRGLDGNQEARKALLALLKEPHVSIRVDLDHQEIVDLYTSESRLSFTDAVVARSSGHFDKQDPVTFDKKISDASRLSREELRRRRGVLETETGNQEEGP